MQKHKLKKIMDDSLCEANDYSKKLRELLTDYKKNDGSFGDESLHLLNEYQDRWRRAMDIRIRAINELYK